MNGMIVLKLKYFTGIILIFFTLSLCVKAESDQKYIVYLKSDAEPSSDSYAVMDKKELSECLSKGTVDFYEPDCEIPLLEDFSLRGGGAWNINAVNAQKAWDIGCYGNYATVAVIDSGVYAHPDLSNNLLPGHNYHADNSDAGDDVGHGTYVAGIIAAEANGEYIDGIASRAKIVPLKCWTKTNSPTTAMLCDAIRDAVDIYHADVINMSFGMNESYTSTAFKLAVKYAIDNGCIVTAAVGNDAEHGNPVYYPAKCDGVIGVGSVNSNLTVSSFSEYNETVDVVAPGEAIASVTIPGFTNNSGTSFACPHVSAMAAIAKCIDKNITASEFQALLKETSTDSGAVGYDTYYGYGLINIEAMIDKMLEKTPLFISPADEKTDCIEATVYNNSQSLLSAKGFAAGYAYGALTQMRLFDIDLPAKGTAKMNCQKEDNIRFMLWNGFKPLIRVSEYINYEPENTK